MSKVSAHDSWSLQQQRTNIAKCPFGHSVGNELKFDSNKQPYSLHSLVLNSFSYDCLEYLPAICGYECPNMPNCIRTWKYSGCTPFFRIPMKLSFIWYNKGTFLKIPKDREICFDLWNIIKILTSAQLL